MRGLLECSILSLHVMPIFGMGVCGLQLATGALCGAKGFIIFTDAYASLVIYVMIFTFYFYFSC